MLETAKLILFLRTAKRDVGRDPGTGGWAFMRLAGIAARGIVFSLLVVTTAITPLSADETASGDVLRALVRDALENNPDLAAARYAAEAKEHLVLPAGSLPDPMLSLAYSNLPVDDFAIDKEPMTSRDIGLTQAIPFPGKLSLKEEIARLDAVQAADRAKSLANLVRFRTKRNFFLLLENREVTRLTERNKALLGELLSVANSRYAVGKALQQDLFKAQVEISRMENVLIALRKTGTVLRSDLNTLRNRPVDDPVDLPASYRVPEILYTEAQLSEAARSDNPDLKRHAEMVKQKEAQLALARRQILPDLQIGAAYKVREDSQTGVDRPDFFTASVMVSLPVWHGRKQDEGVEAALRDLSSAKSGYENAESGIRNRIRDVTAEIARLKESLSLFDSGLLPQARESVNASLSAYQVGQVEFASVLMGRISLYQQEIDREKTAQALAVRTAELELVTGRELF